MRENPYASPQADIGSAPKLASVEPLPLIAVDNPYLAPLFKCRTYVLLSFALFVSFVLLGRVVWLVARLELVMITIAVALAVTLIAFHIFLFLAAHHHGGIVYAIGHVVVSMFLTPALLLGVLLVPVLIRGDVERTAVDTSNTAGDQRA